MRLTTGPLKVLLVWQAPEPLFKAVWLGSLLSIQKEESRSPLGQVLV